MIFINVISNTFPGKPVKLGARRLREQYLPDPATESYYVRVTLDGNLAGNAFYRCWKYNDQSVCWVTQLLVDRNYRERGFASGLLRALQSEADDIYGIMSSHPVACLAAASSFGSKYNFPTIIQKPILIPSSGY